MGLDVETYSGPYTLKPDCSGTLTLTDTLGVTTHWDIFVTRNGEDLTFIQTDAGSVTSGFEIRRDQPRGRSVPWPLGTASGWFQ
ncbi:hypothetical protein D7Y27_33765 [Corallococcus sp. AB004]|nr:hypothetical protein D7Y27_33765 [Corallococcus sp. AB004]